MRQICSCAFGRKECKKRKGTMKPEAGEANGKRASSV